MKQNKGESNKMVKHKLKINTFTISKKINNIYIKVYYVDSEMKNN